MKSKINVFMHNKFEIEVTDSVTGEIKQKAVAYNIVLNSMYNCLVDGHSNIFDRINIGTGTGTLIPTRTSLFNEAIYKNATLVERMQSLPTGYQKKKIVINPEECVGKVITEVGISNYTFGVLTHALLKDAEGNPISINKTATDVLTIYATLYATINTPDNMDLIGYPNKNLLLRFLTGDISSLYSMYVYMGQNDALSSKTLTSTISNSVGNVSISWSGSPYNDVANKKAVTPLSRFSTTNGNGHITEIVYDRTARMLLPKDIICPPMPYSGVSIGTGDGINKKFTLPSKNIKSGTVVVKRNGTILTEGVDYVCEKRRSVNFCNFSDFAKMDDNDRQLVADKRGLWVGKCEQYLVYGSYVNGAIIQNGTISDTAFIQNVSMSYEKPAIHPTENLVAIGLRVSPWIRFYDADMLSGTITPNSTVTLDVPLNNIPYDIAFSSDGKYMAIKANSNTALIYKKNGNTWTKLSITGDTPINPVDGAGMTRYIGDYIFCGNSYNKLGVYKRTTNTDEFKPCILSALPDYTSQYLVVGDDVSTDLFDLATYTGYLGIDGSISNTTDTNYVYSDYQVIKPNMNIQYNIYGDVMIGSICFYDSNKNFISSVKATSETWITGSVTSPSNATFARVSSGSVAHAGQKSSSIFTFKTVLTNGLHPNYLTRYTLYGNNMVKESNIQLPTYGGTITINEFPNMSNFPSTGVQDASVLYLDLSTGKYYGYNGSYFEDQPRYMPKILGLFRLDESTIAIVNSKRPWISIFKWDGISSISLLDNSDIYPTDIYAKDYPSVESDLLTTQCGDDIIPNCNGYYANIRSYDTKARSTDITLTNPPSVGEIMTADYQVNGIHKTDQYIIDVGISIQFGEVV